MNTELALKRISGMTEATPACTEAGLGLLLAEIKAVADQALAQPSPPSEQVERAGLVDELIRCAGRRDVLHYGYMGKVMDEKTYAEFTELRDVRVPQLRAALAAQPATAPAQEQRTCNSCEWSGPVSDCCYLGSIGPLCPECRETTDVEQQQAGAVVEVSDEQIEERARSSCSRYLYCSDPELNQYVFYPHDLVDFVRALKATAGGVA